MREAPDNTASTGRANLQAHGNGLSSPSPLRSSVGVLFRNSFEGLFIEAGRGECSAGGRDHGVKADLRTGPRQATQVKARQDPHM